MVLLRHHTQEEDMVRHVVMWKLKQEFLGEKKNETLNEMKKRIEELPEKVPHILSLSVGVAIEPNTGSSDICLVSEHKDWEDLESYRNHPDHQEVARYIRTVVDERHFLDYEF
jgi:tRNA U34 2-thiouridine synthase MnmA/TrmU